MAIRKAGACFLASVLVLGACTQTQTGDHTTMGAAAGGIVGAGLGAVVGNQVGNTGEGLALGAVAGAGTGALIGSALDRQETAIRTQDEAMERQERIIMAQQNELKELRQMGQDSVSFRGNTQPFTGSSATGNGAYTGGAALNADREVPAAQAPAGSFAFPSQPPSRNVVHSSAGAVSSNPGTAFTTPRAPQAVEPRMPSAINRVSHSSVQERDLTAGQNDAGSYAAARGSYGWEPDSAQSVTDVRAVEPVEIKPAPQALAMERSLPPQPELVAPEVVEPIQPAMPQEPRVETGAVPVGVPAQPMVNAGSDVARLGGSPECVKASDEARSASTAREAADKLFHYRRALRLCPDNADFHNGLGEVYITLNRNEDARYEFQEALKLQPGHDGARSNLSSLQ